MIPGTRHLEEDDAERYSMGRVSEEECARFEAHLLLCEACQTLVTKSDLYVSSMRAAGAGVRREAQKRKRPLVVFPRWAPMAAAAALATILAVLGAGLVRRQAPSPAVAVSLSAMRGPGLTAKAPSGKPLNLNLDVSGLPVQARYRVETVDAAGRPLWSGPAATEGLTAQAVVPSMRKGLCFVRIYADNSGLLREYGLEVY